MGLQLGKIIGDVIGKSGGNIIESAGNVIDKFVTTKEEKEAAKLEFTKVVNENVQKMAELSISETESYLKDVQDARKSNVDIQTSEKVPLFIKIVPYVIDCFVGLIWGGLSCYVIATMLNILKRDPSVNFEGVLGIYTAITGIFMITMNFHRGSSKSSENKQRFMEEMLKK